jgi:hypothetical protein
LRLAAGGSGGSAEIRRLEERVRELERLLGRKTMEVEILKEARWHRFIRPYACHASLCHQAPPSVKQFRRHLVPPRTEETDPVSEFFEYGPGFKLILD